MQRLLVSLLVAGCSHDAKPAQPPVAVSPPQQQEDACTPDIIAEAYNLDAHSQPVLSKKWIDSGTPGPGTLTVRETGKPPFSIDVAADGKITLKQQGGDAHTAWLRKDGVFYMFGNELFFGELHEDNSIVVYDIEAGKKRTGTVDVELAVDNVKLGIEQGRVTGLPEGFAIDVKGCLPHRQALFIAAIAFFDKLFIIDPQRG